MKRTLLASTMAAAILGAAALGVSAIAAPTVTTSVPDRADNFQLTDHTRLAHELHYFRDAKAIVMMPDHPQPPQRQLVPLQQPAAGAAGNRRDFFPNGPLDLKADGTRAAQPGKGDGAGRL